MKNRLVSGVLTASLLAATLAPTTGCGYFLHPERRGNSGGGVDGVTLVFDILWLIPGIIPGVIALVVDFSSGAIYVGGGRRTGIVVSPKGTVMVALAPSTKPMNVEFRFTREDQSALASEVVFVKPHDDNRAIELQLAPTLRPVHGEKIYLEVVNLSATPAAVTATR